jgi:hypothetical protein
MTDAKKPEFVTVHRGDLNAVLSYLWDPEIDSYYEERCGGAPPNDPNHIFCTIVSVSNLVDDTHYTPDQAMRASLPDHFKMPEDFDPNAPPAPSILLPVKSKAVTTVTVTDPDTGLPCDLEIRKLATGELVGVDAAYIERLVDEIGFNNPYAPGEVEIPSDETL